MSSTNQSQASRDMGQAARATRLHRSRGDFATYELACSEVLPTSFVISMAMVVNRPKLSLAERLYLLRSSAGWRSPLVTSGGCSGQTKVTMQYPEERWDKHLPSWYRGAPALVKDEHGKTAAWRASSCEFICPPRAITIVPEEIPASDRWAKVEKRPKTFEIDMIRCIYCGLCEEVCPEQAIFLKKEYSITGYTRQEMVHDKEKLYEIGGVMEGLVYKWNENK